MLELADTDRDSIRENSSAVLIDKFVVSPAVAMWELPNEVGGAWLSAPPLNRVARTKSAW